MHFLHKKNCFEILMAKEMGLDRAPIEFWKLVFLVPPNMVYIAYFTELNLQICNYEQKRRICRGNCKYALDENFHCLFCSRDERLPSSATLDYSSVSEYKLHSYYVFLGHKCLDERQAFWFKKRFTFKSSSLSSQVPAIASPDIFSIFCHLRRQIRVIIEIIISPDHVFH